ncbi:MAG: FISUMP domain-containing protein [Bacteroidota bacterium]
MGKLLIRLFYLILLLTPFITNANTPPTVPVLQFPFNQEPDYTERSMTFVWNQSSDEENEKLDYDFYIGESANNLTLFASDVVETLENDSIIVILENPPLVILNLKNYLLPNRTYYWKIVAKDESGNTSESEIWSLTIGDVNFFAPTKPENLTPLNNVNKIDFKPLLSWSKSSDGDQHEVFYDIYLSTKSNPNDLLVSNIPSLITQYKITSPLKGNTTYYWKVVARDEKGRETNGDVWQFTTTNNTPETPQLIFPTSGSSEIDHNLEFSWQPVEDIDDDSLIYELWYGTKLIPDKLLIVKQNSAMLELASNTTYYWRVVVKDDKGGISESEIRNFTTKSTSNLPPHQPQLLLPSKNATDVTFQQVLEWQVSSDPDQDLVRYNLYTGLHPDSLTLTASKLTDTSYSLYLSANTTYYWQVVANDGKGGVIASSIQNFTTTQDDISLSNIRAYYRYDHPSRLFEYKISNLSPAFDLATAAYTAKGDSGSEDAVALVLNYDESNTSVTVEVPEGFSITESITYFDGLPISEATKIFKIEGDLTLNPLVKVTFASGEAERSYQILYKQNQAPSKPSIIFPKKSDNEVSIKPTFEWEGGDDPDGELVVYQIFLGNSPGSLQSLTFSLEKEYTHRFDLLPSRVYYWKVIAIDDNDGLTESDIYSFETEDVDLSTGLSLLYPREISSYVGHKTDLIWSFDKDVPVTYDIYLDTDNQPARIAQNIQENRFTLNNLSPNTQYYWKVIAKDEQGSTYESELRQFKTKPLNGNETGILTDKRDGQIYQWVRIGEQKWMTHNLAYKPKEKDGYFGYQYWFDKWDASKKNYSLLLHQDENLEKYGYLYSWNAAMNFESLNDSSEYAQGVCPCGWRVATRNDWLKFYPLRNETTLYAKSWGVNSPNFQNDGGLSFLPSGFRNGFDQGNFEFDKRSGIWLGSMNPFRAESIQVSYNSIFQIGGYNQPTSNSAFAVRCVKVETDNLPPQKPILQTPTFIQKDVAYPVRFEWNNVVDPDGDLLEYEIYIDTLSSPIQKVAQQLKNNFFETDLLKPNTTYYWKVRARDIYNEVTDSEVWSFTTRAIIGNTAPSSPQLLLPQLESQDVSVNPTLFTWEAANDGEGDPIAYNFYISKQPEIQILQGKDLSIPQFSISNLETGTTYYWKVIAKDGRGGFVESQIFSFKTINRPPSAPKLLTPNNQNSNVLREQKLTWGRSIDPDGDQVTYTLYVGRSVDNLRIFTETIERSYDFGNFQSPGNTTYYWQVIAKDRKGGETASEIWSFRTISKDIRERAFLTSPVDNATINTQNQTFQWDRPSGFSTNSIFTYDLYLKDRTNSTLIANDIPNTNYTLSGTQFQLRANRSYTWQVVAKLKVSNTFSISVPSTEFTFQTENSLPSIPFLLSPGNNAANLPYMVTLEWDKSTDPDRDILSYIVYLDTNTDPVTQVNASQDTTYYATSLIPNTTYYWKVIARDIHGGTTSSEVRNFTIQDNTVNSPPNKPDLLSPSNFNSQQSDPVRLNWNVVRDIDGDAIRYDLYIATNNNFTSPLVSNLTDTAYLFTVTQPNTKYYWKVVAKDAQDATSSSDTWHFTIKNTPPTAPTLLGPIDGIKLTGSTALLEWRMSQDDDNDSVSYDVYLKESSDTESRIAQGLNSLNFTTPILKNNTVYTWRVVAFDPSGGATTSVVGRFIGKNDPPSVPQLVGPTDNEIIQNPTVTLEWLESSDLDNDKPIYNVYWDTDGTLTQKKGTIHQGTTFSISPLVENTTYYWKVSAIDEEDGASFSEIRTFKYQKSAINQSPSVPKLISPINGRNDLNTSVSLNWQASVDPEADQIVYDLFINNTLLVSGLTDLNYNLSPLGIDKVYTWQIIARDSKGNISSSEVWEFTTGQNQAPSLPTLISPANQATDLATNVTLNWNKSIDPEAGKVVYDVILNNVLIANNISDLTYELIDLDINTTYSWQIVAKDVQGNTESSTVWEFTTSDMVIPQLTISGRITDGSGDGLKNVKLQGAPLEISTDEQGYYLIEVPTGWNGTIKPILVNYAFQPAQIAYTDVEETKVNQDYIASLTSNYILSGKVEDTGGNTVSDVQISGFAQEVKTDATGNFSVSVPVGWSGKIEANLQDYEFSPKSYVIASVEKNTDTLNFTATYTGMYKISGIVKDQSGAPMSQLSLSGFPQQVLTDSNGFYEVIVPAGWSGIVSPEKDDYTFTPENRAFIQIAASKNDQDFSASFIGNYLITGIITNVTGNPIGDVVLEGFPTETITNAVGVYQAEVVAGWSGTVIPKKEGYIFNPKEIIYSDVQENKSAQNFQSEIVSGLGGEQNLIVKIFPNPSKSIVTIQLGKQINSSGKLEIVTTQGKVIKHLQLDKGSEILQWDGKDQKGGLVPAGIYYFSILIENQLQFTEKIIIIR